MPQITADEIGPVYPTDPRILDAAVPCTGKHELFDSTDYNDHAEARALCAACPVIDWCRQHASTVYNTGYNDSRTAAMVGTWAGGLFGRQGVPDGTPARKPRDRRILNELPIAPEEANWSDEDARDAATQYRRGRRDAWTIEGRRIYNRRFERRRRAERRDLAS